MIVVVGTGLSGMTMATALAHHDFDVTLVGPETGTQKDERTTAILQPNCDFLRSLNLWEGAAKNATPLTTMELVNGGSTTIFDASELDLDQFGFNIVNGALKTSLAQRLKKIDWHKTTVTKAAPTKNGWDLQLANGKKIAAPLVIAADGRNSFIRAAANIAIDEKPEAQAAFVAMLSCEKPHYNTSVEWYRSGGPFTLVPCSGKQLALVWCDRDAIIDAQLKTPHAQLSQTITAMTDKRFGTLQLINTPQKWPVRPMKTCTLVGSNVALIGEAAHTLPPIGAQGFNTSLQDIQALLQQLLKGRALGLAPGDTTLLSHYSRARTTDIAARYHGITRLNDLIRSPHPANKFLRRLALGTLQRATPLRHAIMRFAMGKNT